MADPDPEDDALAAAINRGWRDVVAADAAHARGELDDAGWYRAMSDLTVPAYLAAATPQGESGHSGDAADWEYSRGLVADTLDRAGSFLDVGCANGLLMDSVALGCDARPRDRAVWPRHRSRARGAGAHALGRTRLDSRPMMTRDDR